MTKTTPTSPATPNTDREHNGRFAKGNPGGPGNPFARKTAALRQALLDSVTPQDIQEIAILLLFHAKSGDLAAIKLLFQYVIGKPQPAANPDTLDLEELTLLQASGLSAPALKEFTARMPAELAVTTLRAVLPSITKQLLEGIAATVPPPEEAPSAEPEELSPTPRPQPRAKRRRERSPSPDGANGYLDESAEGELANWSDASPSTNDANGTRTVLMELLSLLGPPEAPQVA